MGVEAVAAGAVLLDVEAVDLLLRGDPEPDGVLDSQEQEPGDPGHPDEMHADETQLGPQLIETAAVKEPGILTAQECIVVLGEERDRQGAEGAAHTMHGDGTDRIVDLEPIEEGDGEHHDRTADGTDDDGVTGRDRPDGCRDRHQSGEETVRRHGDVRLPVAQPVDDHRDDRASAARDEGLHGQLAHEGIGGELRARVETEPADEQDERAQHHEGDVVAGDPPGLAVSAVLADAGPEHDGTHQGSPPASGVHDGRAGEVRERELALRKPAATPAPAEHHRVDEGGDDQRVEEVRLELRALGHGTRHDRGCRGGKRGLEEEERRRRQVKYGDTLSVLDARDADAHPAEPAAQSLVAEANGVADQSERQDASHAVHQVLHHDVADVLGPGEASLNEGEPGLHEEHKHTGEEHPDVVEDDLAGEALLLCRRRPSEGHQGGHRHAKTDQELGQPPATAFRIRWGMHGWVSP